MDYREIGWRAGRLGSIRIFFRRVTRLFYTWVHFYRAVYPLRKGVHRLTPVEPFTGPITGKVRAGVMLLGFTMLVVWIGRESADEF